MKKFLWLALFTLMALGCGSKSTEQPATKTEAAKPAQVQQAEPAPTSQPETAAAAKPQAGVQSAPAKRAPAEKPVATTKSTPATPSGAAPEQAKPATPAATPAPAASAPAAAQPAKPAAAAQATKPPDHPIVLTGAPMGGVRFEHAKHKLECQNCHHPSRPQKANTAAQQACTSCHTKPPQPGMTTGKQAAFHNPTATAGTCIDCHKSKGGNAPTKCMQCHKKENA